MVNPGNTHEVARPLFIGKRKHLLWSQRNIQIWKWEYWILFDQIQHHRPSMPSSMPRPREKKQETNGSPRGSALSAKKKGQDRSRR